MRDEKYHALTDDGIDNWPSSHLQKMIATHSPHVTHSKKKLCVLLTTGAMNPAHRGHVAMLTHAKNTLETKHGFLVVGGFLSPSHDLYVGPKSQRRVKASSSGRAFEFANAQERVAMCRLAVEGVEWVDVGTWEARKMGTWPDFPEVLDNLTEHVSSVNIEVNGWISREITVFYVCGTDHARHCGSGFARPNRGLVVVSRAGQPSQATDTERLVFGTEIPSEYIQGISSTAAREACQSGDSNQLHEMLHQDVAAHIIRRGLYGWQQSCVPIEVSLDSNSGSAYGDNTCALAAGKISSTIDACATKLTDSASEPRKDKKNNRRNMFISASALARRWKKAQTKFKADDSANVLKNLRRQCDTALFFFGSKRSWLFPANEVERKESRRQGNYEPPSFPLELSALIKEKESRIPSEVYFLKPPSLEYKGFGYGCHPISHSAPVFQGVSTWLESHGLEPLILKRDWWLGDGYASRKSHTGVTGRAVVNNYEIGEHDYDPCVELLGQSNPTLDPVV